MTNPSVLLELAGRVEALTGPDREVDGEIDRLFHDRPKNGDYDAGEHAIWRVSTGYKGLLVRGDGFARGNFCAAEYTGSMDAAMSLASEFSGQVTFFRDGGAKAFLWQRYPQALEVKAATPALALTAACLRALAAQPSPASTPTPESI